MTLLTGIKPHQLEELEQMFAVLTESGWAIPEVAGMPARRSAGQRLQPWRGAEVKYDQPFYVGDVNIYGYQRATGFRRWNTMIAATTAYAEY